MMLLAAEVAVQVLAGGVQVMATAPPKAAQLRLVLTLVLGPHRVNCTLPVGAGAGGNASGEMSMVAVSVTESPVGTIPVALDWGVVVGGWRTRKHSLVVVVELEPV